MSLEPNYELYSLLILKSWILDTAYWFTIWAVLPHVGIFEICGGYFYLSHIVVAKNYLFKFFLF